MKNQLPDYKEYWFYNDTKSVGYEIVVEITSDGDAIVSIHFPDGDLYTDFFIEKIVLDYKTFYMIHNGEEIINEELDFTDTLNDCICGCFYYFATRY